MVTFTGQKNVALWSTVQLLINYCQEKFNYKNPLLAYLQGSLHCRKRLKIFSCLYLYGDYSSFANAGQKLSRILRDSWIFFFAIFQSTRICVYIPRFRAETSGTLVWKHWSSVKVNAWGCTSTLPYVVLVWCLTL